ncbi:MAG: cell division protein FtsQ/DivIB, partial [Pseudomonadota bacterium]
ILGRSLLNVDAQDARQKIENLAWVEYAAVQKLWPNTVHVSVRERKPQAMWQDAQGQFFLIDQKGTPLEQVSPVDYTKLPLLTGTDSPNEVTVILASLQRRPALYERVAVIVSVGNGRRFDLRFRNDFTAKLPEEAIAASLDRLEALGAGTGKLAESLDYIDLRDPKWAYYKPKSR